MFRNKFKSTFIIFLILTLTWYISNNWIQLTLVQGDSMQPTYHNLQLILIDKHNRNYTYNDIILFKSSNLNATLIKRIIACPGDTVQILDGVLYINEKPSPLIGEMTRLSYDGIASSVIHLSDDEYFVLGDNYEVSKDSRYEEIGCVNLSDILGKAIN